MKAEQDAYGAGYRDMLNGGDWIEIIERDDGYIDASPGPGYFSEYADWPAYEQQAADSVRGRVLDIGCGAGRHCLYFQSRGLDVVGIDVSPLAVGVCTQRGVKDARVLSITEITRSLGVFDTITMMGNNFGLFGSFARARWLLRRFHRLTSANGRIVAVTLDPYQTDNPAHLTYHQRNRKRGRMGGQIRIRERHGESKTPWFDYLFVSQSELKDILAGTGWHVAQILLSDGPIYAMLVEKD
jgi:SAM-dependent methyltransferase